MPTALDVANKMDTALAASGANPWDELAVFAALCAARFSDREISAHMDEAMERRRATVERGMKGLGI